MPWQAIQYVTSGFTLCAFIVAVIAWAYKKYSQEQRLRIESAQPEDRGALVSQTLEGFNVDTTKLTKEQQYDIVLKQIAMRIERFRIIASVVVVLAIIGSLLSGYSISKAAAKSSGSSTGTGSGPGTSSGSNNSGSSGGTGSSSTTDGTGPHTLNAVASIPPLAKGGAPVGTTFQYTYTKNDGSLECLAEYAKVSATIWYERPSAGSPAACAADAANVRYSERESDDSHYILLYDEGRSLFARFSNTELGQSGPTAWRLISNQTWNESRSVTRVK
jgi:hypothetical protein